MIALQALTSLTLVLSLIGILYWLGFRISRRIHGSRFSRQIQIMEKVSLGDKRALLLVRVGKRPYLVGSANGSISMLTEVEMQELVVETEEVDSGKTGSRNRLSFRTILEAMR